MTLLNVCVPDFLEPGEYSKADAYKYFTRDVLGLGEDSGEDKRDKSKEGAAEGEDEAAAGEEEEEEDEDLQPFQRLAQRMTNVTEDGGVKKMLLKEGTGPVVPEKTQVTGQFVPNRVGILCHYRFMPRFKPWHKPAGIKWLIATKCDKVA